MGILSLGLSGRSPREGNGNPLQYSSLGNPMDRGAWQATVHAVKKSRVAEHTHKPAFSTGGEPGAQAGSVHPRDTSTLPLTHGSEDRAQLIRPLHHLPSAAETGSSGLRRTRATSSARMALQ